MGQADDSATAGDSELPEDDKLKDNGLNDNGLDEVDEWGEESFPASDPPAAWSGPPEA